MIKVLEEKSPNWKKCKCPDCGSELAYTRSSIYSELVNEVSSYVTATTLENKKYYIYCPICNMKIGVPKP